MRVLLPTCLGLGIASLALRVSPAYDAWGWLIWGRELTQLELNTTEGPSWKPLPVLVTAVLSPFGDAGPTLWLLLVRTVAVLALGLAARLALRLAGPLAAAAAPILLLLTPDDARFSRYALQGYSEPLMVALVLASIERHLDGRRDHALALGVLAALLRPEVWPLLGLYVLWLWFAQPQLRRLAIVLLPLIPLLWLGGDWLGSGEALTGADRARVAVADDPTTRLTGAIAEAFEAVIAPAWAGAVVAVVTALRRREPIVALLGAMALAWLALLIAMTAALGYYSGGRFTVPAGALLSVLAAVGLVSMARAAGRLTRTTAERRRALRSTDGGTLVGERPDRALVGSLIAPTATVLVLVTLAMPFGAERLRGLHKESRSWGGRAAAEDEIRRLARAPGVDRALAACGPVAVQTGRPRIALSWELEIPLDQARRRLRGEPGHIFAVRGSKRFRRLGRQARGETSPRAATREEGAVRLVASSPRWGLFAVGCDR